MITWTPFEYPSISNLNLLYFSSYFADFWPLSNLSFSVVCFSSSTLLWCSMNSSLLQLSGIFLFIYFEFCFLSLSCLSFHHFLAFLKGVVYFEFLLGVLAWIRHLMGIFGKSSPKSVHFFLNCFLLTLF